jgi:hypothetical protein
MILNTLRQTHWNANHLSGMGIPPQKPYAATHRVTEDRLYTAGEEQLNSSGIDGQRESSLSPAWPGNLVPAKRLQ